MPQAIRKRPINQPTPTPPKPSPAPTPVPSVTKITEEREGMKFEMEIEDNDDPLRMAVISMLERLTGGRVRRKKKD